MASSTLRQVQPGKAKTAFYLCGTRSTGSPDFGKEGAYGNKLSYRIYLYRNGNSVPPRAAKGDPHVANLRDVEINGGREEKLKGIISFYHYSHQLSMVEYEITKDGKLALEPNYYRPKKPEYDLVRAEAKLMVLYDLKSLGVERIQPYRDRPRLVWGIDEAISMVASGAAPRVFGKMPLSEGLQ